MQLLIGELPQRPQTRDVGLRFFDGAVGSFSSCRTVVDRAADRDVVRPEPVHQLVHQDVREERVERDVLLIGGARAPPC